MKKALLKFIVTYAVFLLVFVLQKPLFMAVYHSLYSGIGTDVFFSVIWHGIPVDLSMAAYLTIIPGFLIVAALIFAGRAINIIWNVYAVLISLIISALTVTDLALYNYWGFRLDATPLFYFLSSPKAALASAGTGEIIGGTATFIAIAAIICLALRFTAMRIKVVPAVGRRRVLWPLTMLLLTGALFIPIRGGFTVSTMNPSRAYFSTDKRLNHAATNPAFSFLYSATHQSDFGSQYRFIEPALADSLFAQLCAPQARPDTALLTTPRPDICLIIAESFSTHLMPSLGGEPVAMRLDSIASEGLLFTRFYASSFRTDRALPAILAAFPGQPNTSLMKFISKTEELPSISGSLSKIGYKTAYYYGGDINFTNMLAFLKNAGFEKTVSDADFPISRKTGKWGANDGDLFDLVAADIKADTTAGPHFRVVQTSSSHEPFDVPYNSAFDNNRLNAFAYADSCIGGFVDTLRQSPTWNNTLVIIVPDHFGAYPQNLTDEQLRHRVPLIMTGGALALRGTVDTVGSQTDIAATLLGAMGLDHKAFTYSNDMLSDEAHHFAFYTSPSSLGFVTATDTVDYNLDNNRPASLRGPGADKAMESAKAYLQKLYDNLSNL